MDVVIVHLSSTLLRKVCERNLTDLHGSCADRPVLTFHQFRMSLAKTEEDKRPKRTMGVRYRGGFLSART
jgi:hypothetical protein